MIVSERKLAARSIARNGPEDSAESLVTHALAPGCPGRVAIAAVACVVLVAVRFVAGTGVRTLRLPLAQATFATVEQGIFHDLIPLRASVIPRETVYVDAIEWWSRRQGADRAG